jgi:type III pantothenate kinase
VIIAVDIGNSAVKAALVEGASVHGSGRLATNGATTDDLADGLRTLAGRAAEPPRAILAASVVDRWTERLEQAAGVLGLPLTVVGAPRIPIGTALPRPDLVGPDRLLGAWAASRLYSSPVVVVDLGTATTLDAVDADGVFLGGAILPGLGLAADALAQGTARLPRVALALPEEAIGTDTEGALQSGIVIGHLGAVRELVLRMRARLVGPAAAHGAHGAGTADRRVRVVVTGGHAEASWAQQAWREPADGLPAIADHLDPSLLLRGLGLLAEDPALTPGLEVTR